MPAASNKRIISCAVTGAVHSPTMSPYLPITPEQIAGHALDAAAAGAAVVHLHARNPEDGSATQDLAIFREIISRIRDRNNEVIICISTGGGPGMSVEQRAVTIPEFRPELASMNSGSINWGLFTLAEKYEEFKYPWEGEFFKKTKDIAFMNSFTTIEAMLEIMYSQGTKPELEVYDIGQLYNLAYLVNKGLVRKPLYLQFVTGILGGIASTPYDIMNLHTTADRLFGRGEYAWSIIGAGKNEFKAAALGLMLGSQVRVGMEDNLYVKKGVMAKNNAELVEKMVRIMDDLGYEPARPEEAREILSLSTEGKGDHA